MADLELELVPLDDEMVLRAINRGKTRLWWCGPSCFVTEFRAVDEHGATLAVPKACSWAGGHRKCAFNWHKGTLSLSPGESLVLARARARETDTGVIIELRDDAPVPGQGEECLEIGRERVMLEASWTIGDDLFRSDWCHPAAKNSWDERSRSRQDMPWNAGTDRTWVFPPDRDDIDGIPDRGRLVSNRVEVVADSLLVSRDPFP